MSKFTVIILMGVIYFFQACTSKPSATITDKRQAKQSTNAIDSMQNNGYVIDTTFKLSDSNNEIIFTKLIQSDRGDNHFHFYYFTKQNNNWILKSNYDSLLTSEANIYTEHTDFNNDNQLDFTFKAEQGVRGANRWFHILLYNPKEQQFVYLKHSNQVCSPWYDYKE